MFKMVFRFVALFLIISALMLIGADLIGTLEAGGQVQLRSLGKIVGLFAPGAAIPDSGAMGTLMSVPAWSVLGIAGVVLAFIFRSGPDDSEYES